MKAMILAAGYGTRLKPITDDIPKALVKINGITLLENAIKTVSRFGFDEIIINVHHFSEKVKEFIKENKFPVKITISDESEKLLDTGGGLKKASWFFNDEDFLLYNVDIVSDINLEKMLEQHRNNPSIATLAVRKRESARYLLFNDNNILCGWESVKSNQEIIKRIAEKYTPMAFSGIHIINSKIFQLMPKENKFSIIKLYLEIANSNRLQSFDHSNSLWIDAGKIKGLKLAKNIATQNTKNYTKSQEKVED
ncbi:MAG: nucleotidyltransferase family protein [Candidatus Marinimicrobia bacterium]|nr:nucleotidyltransferase family protein [Candidatus Neomarinimicrobiota bacterium]